MNRTILTLVPKVAHAELMRDFRPIACCNFIYKCYTSLIARRIKNIMPTIISPCQNAFVPGRQISENVLLMHEIVKRYHRDQGKARAVIKFDIRKAYDTVSWEFLLSVMQAMKFLQKVINIVNSRISSTHFFN